MPKKILVVDDSALMRRVLCDIMSYSQGGVMHGGYGVTGVLATVYSLIGLILGVLTLRDKDIYRFFPVLGTILNVISLGGISFLLYLGSRM